MRLGRKRGGRSIAYLHRASRPRKGPAGGIPARARTPHNRVAASVRQARSRCINVNRAIASQAAGAAFCAAVSFLLLAWLARWLGPGEFGRYVWLLSVAVVALIAIEGGWPALVYRESARLAPREPLPLALAGARHALAVTAVAALVAAWWAGPALALGLLCMGGVALGNLVSGRLRGAGRFGREALWQSGLRAASALAIVFALGYAPATASTVFAAWSVALLIIVPPVAWRVLGPARTLPSGAWFASAWVVGLEAALVLLQRGDMAALGWLGLRPEELAHYAAGTRFTELALLALAPVTNVVLRALRHTWPDTQAFRRLLRRALLAAGGAGAVAFLLALVCGEQMLTVVFGARYRDAGPLLPWILAALPLLLCNVLLVQASLAQGREVRATRALLPASIATLLALVCGALGFGVRGAAAGMFLGQAVAFLLLRSIVRRPPDPAT